MSFAHTTCKTCGEEFSRESGFRPGYCSQDCYERKQAHDLLHNLKHDHRFCHACFAELKEVDRPSDNLLRSVQGMHVAEALTGFQSRTPEAGRGVKTETVREDRKETVSGTTTCDECGSTEHQDDYMRDFEIQRAAKNLRKRIEQTRDEGQHDYSFDTEAFVESWNESKDWELALGRAIV